MKLNISPEALARFNAERVEEEEKRRARKVKRDALSQEYLRSILEYAPETGQWYWRVDRVSGNGKSQAHAGDLAGGAHDDLGYRCIYIDKLQYYASRLAFLYTLGRWPKDDVDHINGRRDDDRWDNLREANRSENCINRVYPLKASGLPRGITRRYKSFEVTWCKRFQGSFITLDEALAARKAAELEYMEFLPRRMSHECGT
jgi:hypothetical protein